MFPDLLRRLWPPLRRTLYVTHRWLGIAGCLLFVLWFLSGLVMMYVRLPVLSDAERLQRAAAIDWHAVHISPAQALQAASDPNRGTLFPNDFRLQQWLGEPVYRYTRNGQTFTISASNGQRLAPVDKSSAERIVREFAGNPLAYWQETLDRDQWTVTSRFNLHRPLFRIVVPDQQGSELYVSGTTGEVMLQTTRTERFWNWCGAVTHWFYLTALRQHQTAWEQVVIWVSGIGIVIAASGLWIGLMRIRLRTTLSNKRMTPYRGWLAWHHVSGVLGGTFLLTWIVSGWLSMSPLPLGDERALMRMIQAKLQYEQAVGEFPFTEKTKAVMSTVESREVRFVWQAGLPVMLVSDGHNHTVAIDPHTGKPIVRHDGDHFAAMRQLLPDATLHEQQRLEQPDRYWYSHHYVKHLPVLRGKFDDASHTWIHLDPNTGELLQFLNDDERNYRWYFHALHSFDFPWLLELRPLWDILVWLLSLAGLTISVSGVVIGWRRLFRD